MRQKRRDPSWRTGRAKPASSPSSAQSARPAGGAAKGADAVYDDARAIRDGGGHGSIIGRNSFQRPREDALAMLAKLVDIYKGRA